MMEREDKDLKKAAKTELHGKWRREHFYLMLGLSAVMSAGELLTCLFIRNTEFLNVTPACYMIKYAVVPGLCFAAVDLAVFFLLRTDSIPAAVKNYIVSLGFVLICIVICIMHDFFIALFAIGMVAVSLTAVYGDISLTAAVTVIMTTAEGLVGFLSHWDHDTVKNDFYKANLVMYLVMIVVSGCVSILIIKWEDRRIFSIALKQRQIELLRRQTTCDVLTGMPNRLALRNYINEQPMPIVFCMCDIDYFKKVNDTWGHSAGDEVLVMLGRILSERMNGNRRAFRFGGDEFLLSFTGMTEEQAAEECRSLQKAFDDNLTDDIRKSGVKLSIGIAVYKAGMTPHEAIETADKALYAGKHSGSEPLKVF